MELKETHQRDLTKEEMFNLTDTDATYGEIVAGAIDPTDELKKQIRNLWHFKNFPTDKEIKKRSKALAQIAFLHGKKRVMVAGPHWMTVSLCKHLRKVGVIPFAAFLPSK